MSIEKGNDDVDNRWLIIGDINSSTLLSVVAAADDKVDAALAATNDEDEGVSVRLVELVVFMNGESCLLIGQASVGRNEGTWWMRA